MACTEQLKRGFSHCRDVLGNEKRIVVCARAIRTGNQDQLWSHFCFLTRDVNEAVKKPDFRQSGAFAEVGM